MYKLYLSEISLKEMFRTNGINYIIKRIKKEEIIICMDNFSKNLLEKIIKDDINPTIIDKFFST